ncbi:MAG: glycine cleavage system aminomethyltransferase GcvT [Oscillospiraceae bacterium]|nr:glycine cleavage system aminomethyltransferase GcvT [Oscillospiraceae bacterium]
MEKKTPLYDIHVEEGGKIVPFAGYLLPVQYGTGVIAEHMAVRQACGLFDVSHMGEILFTGKTALDSLHHIMTNRFTDMPVGKVRYTVMCNEHGGCVDDLIVYKFGEECYLAVVNASNRDKDYAHILANLLPGTKAEDLSDNVAEIALQGPKAPEILAQLLPPESIPKGYYTAVQSADIDGMNCMISRTGYTGELGYEIFTANENAEKLWRLLRKTGEPYGLIPCGLGARDTLRLEAGMPLYGHEMDEDITPLEADLGFGVKLDKPEFIGRDALLAAGEPKRIRVGLEITGRGIVREHQPLFSGDREIGASTSGTHCPYLGKPVAMALVEREFAAPGTELEADVRGRRVACRVIPYVFYKRSK